MTNSTETGRTDRQRRSPETEQKSAARAKTSPGPVSHHEIKTEAVTTKGGPGIAARQRIKINGKLREELDYHLLAYALHVMAKRRVDDRRRRAEKDREKREKPR